MPPLLLIVLIAVIVVVATVAVVFFRRRRRRAAEARIVAASAPVPMLSEDDIAWRIGVLGTERPGLLAAYFEDAESEAAADAAAEVGQSEHPLRPAAAPDPLFTAFAAARPPAATDDLPARAHDAARARRPRADPCRSGAARCPHPRCRDGIAHAPHAGRAGRPEAGHRAHAGHARQADRPRGVGRPEGADLPALPAVARLRDGAPRRHPARPRRHDRRPRLQPAAEPVAGRASSRRRPSPS